MQQTRKTELWVGSFVLAGICAILVMIFQVADVKSIGSGNTYTLKAEFDNIGSLKVRSPVKVGGVVVGRVSDITLNPESLLPIVSLSINSQYNQFPETSSLQILTSGLIGEQYIGLVPGFIFDDEEMLVDGDTIEDTKSALVLEDLIGQVLYSIGGSGDSGNTSKE
ncbi:MULTISPECIES: outer membrane lipid asymmetry maintenance protein MlaD [Gammaproteobacteria]|jgi:phospholipid/cholesterol/gamma-HCH transport system substrate-binding protein|uniref:Intermembrane phospholipid transport system, substrate binding protein MlaD n=1 Tax=Vibrio jasicida TaxID=766224 RepID=A0AAU9QL08_9VIBR|nr:MULTISPECIES: outer membrane lipid asymmetry maintenance protein MlaD [Vibrio]KIP68964.1 toluene ABC transporter substrate-binding protein [Vibrio harveyi]KIP74803.1 toluene ABC transporter substrate-binding protein [Vibrio harveyi]MCF6454624.1 outer membrane lipid asymmetry maintenance protein MlaD [Vibrio sp. MMG023]MCX2790405.1 outer membrane lipid asymmetry maintenance protein MlaD [Vibrio sp. Sgm 5]NOJ18906.1 outer membrane lipid asymmetry maintenance protein MlaD [Vibrio jasicida]